MKQSDTKLIKIKCRMSGRLWSFSDKSERLLSPDPQWTNEARINHDSVSQSLMQN